MNRNLLSVRMTLFVNRFIALILAALVPTLPLLLDWYCHFRILTQAEYWAIAIAFYLCTIPVSIALWNLDKLLRSILQHAVFTQDNVRCIRHVRWCCGGVSLICLPAAFIYLPLFFMVVIMVFLCLVVNVVAQVMAAAVSIREENDLTI